MFIYPPVVRSIAVLAFIKKISKWGVVAGMGTGGRLITLQQKPRDRSHFRGCKKRDDHQSRLAKKRRTFGVVSIGSDGND